FRATQARGRTADSSSTISTVSPLPGAEGESCWTPLADGGGAAAWSQTGRNTLNVEPRPTWLATSIQPSCCLTIPRMVERPKPVLLPPSLVGKDGWEVRASGS